MKRFEIVDFLKGYSIFSIMIFHYLDYLQPPSPFNKIIIFGGAGVHLFILLSGFGLYYSYLNKPLRYGEFIKKRLLKVYVPYIFVILISALISIFIPVYDNSWYALGGHLFLYKMFDNTIVGSYGFQLWFISTILQFYLAFHVIAWLQSKLKNQWFLTSGVLISIGWMSFVCLINKGDERIWSSFFLQYYWEFALGMVIAERVFRSQGLIGENINQLSLFAIAITNCAIYGSLALKCGTWGKSYNDFFALTGYSLLAVLVYNMDFKPMNRMFLFIGKISLSVYLLHIVVLLSISKLLPAANNVYAVTLALIIILPLSVIYQKIVDNIFNKGKSYRCATTTHA